MNKNIKFYNNKLQYILLISLSTQLHAVPYQHSFHVGIGYDINKSTILPSPFQNIDIQTERIKQKNVEKIVQIKNIIDLFQAMEITPSLDTLKSKKVDKLLNNPNINDYTLTYLLYSRITTLQNTLLLEEIQNINQCKNYINNIKIGGEYIALINIKTNSINDYKKVEKYINKQKLIWKYIDTFAEKIYKLSDTHIITVKNIIIADQTLLPTNDLKISIEDAKKFKQTIINHEAPYEAKLIRCKKELSITTYLKAKQTLHNLNYIRKNSNQFKQNIQPEHKEQLKEYLLKVERDINEYNDTKLADILKNISYPKRYKALINKPIHIEKLILPENTIEKKYPKILEKKIVSVKYNFKLKIQNNGNVILLTWTKTVKVGTNTIHKEQNSKILLDSYINFKGLKATQIDSYNIGSLIYKTKFDAYIKSEQLKGFGMIEKANCGYTIDKKGTLDISCKDIKLKDLDIKFKHEK